VGQHIAIPLGTVLAIQPFAIGATVIALLNPFMGPAAVVVGLVIYVLLSRAGPWRLGLLFTPTAMVNRAGRPLAQPLIASVTHQGDARSMAGYNDLLIFAESRRKRQADMTLIYDGRAPCLTACWPVWPRGSERWGDHDRPAAISKHAHPRADHSKLR